MQVGPNLYAYVRQNPWTAFDPGGLQLWMIEAPLTPLLRGMIEVGEFSGRSGGAEFVAPKAPSIPQGNHVVPKPSVAPAATPKPAPATNFRPSLDPTIIPNPQSAAAPASPTTSSKDTQSNNHKILYIQNNYDEGSPQSNELHEFVGRWNSEIVKHGGATTTRSVDLYARTAADRAAGRERARNRGLYDGKVVGHLPDVGAGGDINGPFMPVSKNVNGSIGVQVGWYHR